MWQQLKEFAQKWHPVVSVGTGVFIVVTALRLTGGLQFWEWGMLDRYFQFRHLQFGLLEQTERRIVIVSIRESDLTQMREGFHSIGDATLAKLITKIKGQQPRVIGMDLYRDLPVSSGYEKLAEVFKSTPNLVAIQKVVGGKISPPPALAGSDRVSDSTILPDGDGVVRRAYISVSTDTENGRLPNLGYSMAIRYLEKEGINARAGENGSLEVGETAFPDFDAYDGGYVRADDGGYQIPLNYRGPAGSFKKVSASEVLSGQINSDLFRDRIVLIGPHARSLQDGFYTPYSTGSMITRAPEETCGLDKMCGVEVHANLASQILTSVLDNRPLIKTWDGWLEWLWLALWIEASIIWGWWWQWKIDPLQKPLKLVLVILAGASGLVVALAVSSYLLFLMGWWVPVVPPLLGLVISGVVVGYHDYIARLQKAQLELEESNAMLKARAISLRDLTGGFAHQTQNPLSRAQTNISSIRKKHQALEKLIEEKIFPFEKSTQQEFEDLWSQIEERLSSIQTKNQNVKQLAQDVAKNLSKDNEPTPTNINNLMNEAFDWVKSQREKQEFEIKLETNYDFSIKKIEIVSLNVKQSLVAIIDNAYLAIENKRNFISKEFKPIISLGSKNLENSVEIWIEDNGKGISQEEKDRIFNPFYTKDNFEGRGLGLFFAQDNIEIGHKGKIKVQSNPNKYSKFIITLPKKFRQTVNS